MTYQSHAQFSDALAKSDQRSPRSSTFLGARLRWGSTERPAQVRDLSETGALVILDPAPPAGTPVMLIRGEYRLHAQAVWAFDGRCGLRFMEPITVPDVIKGKPPEGVVRDAAEGRSLSQIDELCSRADRLAASLAERGDTAVDLHRQAIELGQMLRRLRL